MKFKKKAIVAGVFIFLGLLVALPATRDELNWRWACSVDTASAYDSYLANWPAGRHLAEAKSNSSQRVWAETKRAMIAEAVKKNNTAQADPAAQEDRKTRLEEFFWKQVTNENTGSSYRDYLERYPSGQFSAQARQKLNQTQNQPAVGK